MYMYITCIILYVCMCVCICKVFLIALCFYFWFNRYKIISYDMSRYISPTPSHCAQILSDAGLKKWAIGNTKACNIIICSEDNTHVHVHVVLSGWVVIVVTTKVYSR